MATNLQFIPGRKQGSENPILNGFRYVFDKRSNDTSYWKCSEFRKGCRARIRTVDRQLITPTPDHTHPVHHAETTVHVSKQNLKRKASGGDQPTKYLVSEAVGGLGYESRAKLGCQLSSLNRMVQRSRKAANRHPSKRDGRELPEPRAPKWIRYDRQLQRIVDDYDNYSNPMDFLKAIGNLTML